MDYKKHIKELEVYSYFNADTIPEIVEYYMSGNWSEPVPDNISKENAVWALMEWLYDNADSWYFVNVLETVDFIKESIPFPENLEEALDMKKAHDILEDMYEDMKKAHDILEDMEC